MAGRLAVVTGGGKGIGRAIAARLTADGDRVVIAGRDRAALDQTAEEVPGIAEVVECDVTQETAVEDLFKGAGNVDVLINNAGVETSAPLGRTGLEAWQEQLDTNATGAFLCTRAVVPGMLERDYGRVVFISSTASHAGFRYTSAYASSKHAAIGLMRAVAAEVTGTGVTMNSVSPTFVNTEMWKRWVGRVVSRTGRDASEAAQALAESLPLGRVLEPDEVAAVVAFLASDEAAVINGQTPDSRRRRRPGVTPFRSSAALTETWESFDVAIDDGVVTITLARPEKLNALTFEAYADLRDLLAELPHRGDARVAVITGEGRGFCSGGDVEEIIGELQKMDVRELLDFTRMTGSVVRGIRDCPLPVIAAVNGIAAGAGAVIALACDLRLLAESAKFAFLFTRVGLAGADMGSAYLLPRIVGLGRASELLLLGDRVDSRRAAEIGLATEVIPDDELSARASELAKRLAGGPALAHEATKLLIARELDTDFASAIELEAVTQALLMKSDDHGEFHEAFKAGRDPKWSGR